ncbi:MAG: FG-GAP-like repeat-containing protein, partial [Verrucomicrobiota bacterium]
GDGDLDIFLTNEGPEPNTVWLNDGTGMFTDSGQSLGFEHSQSVSLGDLDGDGDLDAFVAQDANHPARVWENDGAGTFSDSGQTLAGPDGLGCEVGDLDGDGDLDAFLANLGGNTVWLNECVLTVIDHTPAAGALNVSTGQSIIVTFDDAYLAASITSSTFIVRGDHYGVYPGAFSALSPTTIQFTATAPFGYGEEITVDLLNGIQRLAGGNLVPYQFRFTVAADSCGTVSVFSVSQTLGGNFASDSIDLGDVDGDGDLDVMICMSFAPGNLVFLNNGSGAFVDSGQMLGGLDTRGFELGDLDGDGDLDAFFDNFTGGSRVWTNDGSGVFGDTGQDLGGLAAVTDAELGDVDGDGDLDAVTSNDGTFTNRLWLNNGFGIFTDSGQDLLQGTATGVELGDLDGDGDLDLIIAYNSAAAPSRIFFNDGFGRFSLSAQDLGRDATRDIDTGDLDGDGDLDLFIANFAGRPNRVWLNDGGGVFADSGQALGAFESHDAELADLDGDGDLDVWVANQSQSDTVWLNDGAGNFSDAGLSLGTSFSEAVDIGDIDGDGDQDVLVANVSQRDLVWLNDCLVTLGDYVWEDTNADGIQDGGEPGVSNVLVELYDGSGTMLLSNTVTDAAGLYFFEGLPNNTNYEIRVTPPESFSFTLLNQGSDDALDS